MQMVPYKYLCNSDAGSCSSHSAWAASQCWVPAKHPTSPGKECCCTTPTTTALPGNYWNTTLISTTTSQGICINITRSVIYMQLMLVVVVTAMRRVRTSAHVVREWVEWKSFIAHWKLPLFLKILQVFWSLPIFACFYKNEHVDLTASESHVMWQNKLRRCGMRGRNILVGNRGTSLPMEAATCKDKLT